jgi:hypothetical protein
MNEVLKQRDRIYGDFGSIAETSQKLKALMGKFYDNADPVCCEAMDMILHKLARMNNTCLLYTSPSPRD